MSNNAKLSQHKFKKGKFKRMRLSVESFFRLNASFLNPHEIMLFIVSRYIGTIISNRLKRWDIIL